MEEVREVRYCPFGPTVLYFVASGKSVPIRTFYRTQDIYPTLSLDPLSPLCSTVWDGQLTLNFYIRLLYPTPLPVCCNG